MEDDVADNAKFPDMWRCRIERPCCHLNATVMYLFSCQAVRTFLRKSFPGEGRLNELKEIYCAMTEEQSAASTMHLQRQLEQYPNFQNCFGKCQDAGDSLARLMDLIASGEAPEQSLSDLMLIRVRRQILHSCHSKTMDTTHE
jgi:hypothetical protein